MSSMSVAVSTEDLVSGERRLDATYYTTDVSQAEDILSSSKYELKKIGDLSERTFNPPPIKRVYTDDEEKGTPYMLPQEMFEFYWEPEKYVLEDKMDKIEEWFLEEDWVVLTQSGSVGRPYYTSVADSDVVLSQNAIRIPVKNKQIAGFIYAYLSTWIGQTLLKKDEFGITVKHIRPHHVDDIPIPDIGSEKMKEISRKIKEAFELRSEAIDLIDEAKQEIYEALGAPEKPNN